MSRIIFIVVLCSVLAVQAEFPADPKPCKYGDSGCIVKMINYLIREKAMQGDRDFNLVKLDPLPVAKMNIKQGAESPVNIDLTFKDNQLLGISTMKFRKVKGFGKDIAKKHEILFNAGKLSLVGPYNIKGKVLILPISGTGKSNMTLVNCDIVLSFTGKPFEKNGETYMEASNLKITTKPDRMYYYFTNLFNGDKALGDNMNAFLNDNWEAIFLEVKQSMELAFAGIFQTIITDVFSKYPYAKFFEE
ncbi:protein takeout-like [Drosophila novamexicana]|uniref:protein takeout-like n=1 Tax=Drosophila novamexicana TaxID=47314 RepID=UPI0011E5F9BC|nr:protein takeout-like [Drosophila novamexicana]